MSSEWHETTLEDLLKFSNGKSSPERSDDGDLPVYGSNGIIGYSDEQNADADTIVIGRVGSYCGSLYFSQTDCWITDNAIAATAKKSNNPRFLYYLLTTLNLNSWRGGSGQPLLNQRILNAIETQSPDSDTQRAIAKILGDLDDRIDLLREINTTLEQIARAVFRAWFVEFEPIRAKAAGATSFRGMPQNVFDTLPDSFISSEIGDIPTGWTVKPLSELVSQPVKRGLAPKYIRTGGVAVLNQKCVRDWEVNLELGRRHDAEVRPLKDKSVERFDILVNSTGVGTLGRVAQVYHLNEETTVDSHLSLVKPDPQKIAPILLGINLTEREEEIERLGHGSTGQTELNRHKLGELGVLVPKEEIQSAFEDIALPLVERKTSNTHEAAVLSSVRDTLLPKLISGELEAPSLDALGLESGE